MVSENTVATEKLNNYELIFIVKPDLTEDKLEAVVENVKRFITTKQGVITDMQKWGKRRLAYPIKHYNEGHYTLVKCQMKPETNKDLETSLRISEDVLRHLIVKLD
jgi:small subunit ribosomal protein S6